MRICIFLCCLVFSAAGLVAQPASYSTFNGHAHNDYLNTRPFYDAFLNGMGSIEADVFPVGETLCVAHTKKEIDPRRTLDSLYLRPIQQIFSLAHQPHGFLLLVDIKEDYRRSLELLVRALRPLQPWLSQQGKKGWLTVVISGARPGPAEFNNYPSYIFFDDDLRQKHTPESWSRVALVSMPFTRFSKWKGEGRISKSDRSKLHQVIDSTHKAGKPIRFWAAPDTKKSWKLQRRLRVDLIGTDRVAALAAWLKR